MIVRSTVLDKVKSYIDNELNPLKHNFSDKSKNDFEHVGSVNSILNQMWISEEDYYNSLSISDDYGFQVHLQWLRNSCFVSNCFRIDLLAKEANLDIQPVFSHCKAVTYMCVYLSKTEDGDSNAVNQTFKESISLNVTKYDQLKSFT